MSTVFLAFNILNVILLSWPIKFLLKNLLPDGGFFVAYCLFFSGYLYIFFIFDFWHI